ncbi:DUF732 domain-containing protein [Mycolicibacter algericus]|uniref:DUF732 domain-containing protein n=2 Tax=Mycolicibacter algericus TaxID=1288388 RepID=A0A7I9Y4K9_MYCAL|nr:DUF732 domain-containing protein [Mycolicibacter algericus]GFG83413.1 hypothetical protein MALGJ_00890 [Mycolicibacter algericus]
MPDEETAVAAGEALHTAELDPAATVAGRPLAYSDHTSSMPVVDYQPPRSRAWWRVAALVAAILTVTGSAAAAILLLDRTPVAQQAPPSPVPPAPATVRPAPSPTAEALPIPPAPVPPPTVTVTATPGPAPAATPESLPPDAQFIQLLARDGVSNSHPSGAIATAKNVCLSIENGSSADDFVLSMNAAGMPYREAVAFVRAARSVYCPNAG